MTSEAQVPDALLAHAGWSGMPAVTDIDDDPDGPDDGNWLAASGNNVNTDARVSFPTPSDGLTGDADLQEFRAKVRQFDGDQTGTPTARIELWEAGTLVRAGSNTDITSATSQILSFTWNATEISAAADVECKIIGTKTGGSPTARNTVDAGAVEWVADITVGDTVLSINDATEAQAADGVTFTQVHDLVVADAANTHNAEAASFSQVHGLTIAEASDGQAAEATSFVQVHDFAIIDASHSHSAGNATFDQIFNLATGDAAHAKSAEVVQFSQIHEFLIAGAAHGQGLEATSFAQVHDYLIDGPGQGQLFEEVGLDQNHELRPADAVAAHAVGEPGLSQLHILAVAEAMHAMDNPGIVMVPQLIPGPPTAFLKAALGAPHSNASEGGTRLRGSLR